MTTSWDPRRLLSVDPEIVPFTCVGFAPSKGRRCHNIIAEHTLSEPISILNEIQMMDLYHRGFMDRISPKLDHLTATTLCKGYHRDKPGHSQRFQMHNKWMKIVSDWRNDMLARRAYGNVFQAPQLAPSPSPITPSPSPNIIHAPQAVLPTPLVIPSPSFDVLPIFNPPVPTPNQAHYTPAVPQHQVAVPFGLLGPHPDNATVQPQTIYQQQIGESSQSPPSSTASAAGSNSSFHDSGYSTAPSSTTSDSELPLNEPAMLFPSPPSSIWSMDPPSPSPSSPSSEVSSPSTAEAHTPTSSNSPSRSSRSSRNSSGPQAPLPSTTFTNALAAALAAALTAEPSSPSISSFSTARSSNNSSSTRRSSRSQVPSVTTANPLATSIATALATVLTEHITTALTQELAHSDGLAALTPLLQSLFGIQVPSRRSSRTSSHRSTRSSTSSTQASPNPSPIDPAPPTPSTPSSQPTASASTTPTVIRRPLTDPCYVCILPIDDPDDAVWCRASCGQKLHTECFEMWAESQLNLVGILIVLFVVWLGF